MDKPNTNPSNQRPSKQTGVERMSKKKAASRPVVVPLSDSEIVSPPGIPVQADMDEVARELSPKDRKMFKQVQKLLAEHLGSYAAARLWLVTQGTGFETTALDAIRKGQAQVVLATLESQWGPSPSYA